MSEVTIPPVTPPSLASTGPERYGRVVSPIYLARAPGKISHLGSGVLVQSTEGHWLFTAAHVLADKIHGKILLPGVPDFFTPINNVVSSCELLPGIAQRDRIDMSYLALTEDEAKLLQNGGARFLPATNDTFEPNGITPYPGIGTITGYPNSAVQIEGREINVHLTNLLNMKFASHERLRRAGFDPEITIGLIRHQKEFLDRRRLHKLELRGLSGGAIWAHHSSGARLVGIFTEYHSNRSLLIGTRLKPLVMELARRLKQLQTGQALD